MCGAAPVASVTMLAFFFLSFPLNNDYIKDNFVFSLIMGSWKCEFSAICTFACPAEICAETFIIIMMTFFSFETIFNSWIDLANPTLIPCDSYE